MIKNIGLPLLGLFLFPGLVVSADVSITPNEVRSGRQQVFSIIVSADEKATQAVTCLLYTSPSPRDQRGSRMPSSA